MADEHSHTALGHEKKKKRKKKNADGNYFPGRKAYKLRARREHDGREQMSKCPEQRQSRPRQRQRHLNDAQEKLGMWTEISNQN